MTFADAENAGKRRQTRKKLFPIEVYQVVMRKDLIAKIAPAKAGLFQAIAMPSKEYSASLSGPLRKASPGHPSP